MMGSFIFHPWWLALFVSVIVHFAFSKCVRFFMWLRIDVKTVIATLWSCLQCLSVLWKKHSFRQQGQGRLSGSIGYLLSNLEATTMNILVHKKAIAVWIASSYCTSSFRDKGLLNIYNFLPVHLSTRQWTDKRHELVCVCVCGRLWTVCVSAYWCIHPCVQCEHVFMHKFLRALYKDSEHFPPRGIKQARKCCLCFLLVCLFSLLSLKEI